MSGLFERLAARGTGRPLPDDLPRLAPPVRSRFAPPLPNTSWVGEVDGEVVATARNQQTPSFGMKPPPPRSTGKAPGGHAVHSPLPRPEGPSAFPPPPTAESPAQQPPLPGHVAPSPSRPASEPGVTAGLQERPVSSSAPPESISTSVSPLLPGIPKASPIGRVTASLQPSPSEVTTSAPPADVSTATALSSGAPLSGIQQQKAADPTSHPSPSDGIRSEETTSRSQVPPEVYNQAIARSAANSTLAPRLSIDRLNVIFEAPPSPPEPRRRPRVNRTRGFAGYERARLGRMR